MAIREVVQPFTNVIADYYEQRSGRVSSPFGNIARTARMLYVLMV